MQLGSSSISLSPVYPGSIQSMYKHLHPEYMLILSKSREHKLLPKPWQSISWKRWTSGPAHSRRPGRKEHKREKER